jgi:hypothetical protein
MKSIFIDITTFFKRFWTIIFQWFTELLIEHKFKNSAILIPFVLLRFFFRGDFSNWLGWACFFVWVGINIQAIIAIVKEYRTKI